MRLLFQLFLLLRSLSFCQIFAVCDFQKSIVINFQEEQPKFENIHINQLNCRQFGNAQRARYTCTGNIRKQMKEEERKREKKHIHLCLFCLIQLHDLS